VILQRHGRREAAHKGWDRRLLHAGEAECRLRVVEHEGMLKARHGLAFALDGDDCAVWSNETDLQRNGERLLLGLPRRRRGVLRDGEVVRARRRVANAVRAQARRAGLVVPAHEVG
jgi:hypothetical protein